MATIQRKMTTTIGILFLGFSFGPFGEGASIIINSVPATRMGWLEPAAGGVREGLVSCAKASRVGVKKTHAAKVNARQRYMVYVTCLRASIGFIIAARFAG